MNDRLWTMKVAVEKVGKFICVILLFSETFQFPAQPTSRSQSVYPEYVHLFLLSTLQASSSYCDVNCSQNGKKAGPNNSSLGVIFLYYFF